MHNFTILSIFKCIGQSVALSTFALLCNLPTSHFQSFFILPDRNSVPLNSDFAPPLCPALATTILLSVHEFEHHSQDPLEAEPHSTSLSWPIDSPCWCQSRLHRPRLSQHTPTRRRLWGPQLTFAGHREATHHKNRGLRNSFNFLMLLAPPFSAPHSSKCTGFKFLHWPLNCHALWVRWRVRV